MSRLTQKDMLQILKFVRVLQAPCSLDELPGRVLTHLAQLIDSDLAHYTSFDVQTGISFEIQTFPDLPLGSKIKEIALTTGLIDHPLNANYMKTGDGSALMLSDFVTERELHQLEYVYGEVLHPLGLEEELGIAIAVKPSQPGISQFFRTRQNIAVSLDREHRNFTDRDRLVLNLIRPHLLEAYYSAQIFTQMQYQIAELKQTLEQTGVVIVSIDGQVEEMTQRAETLIKRYFQTSTPSLQLKPLPDTLQRWIKHQITQWICTEDILPISRLLQLERDGQRLTVRLNRHPNSEKFLLLLEESNHQAFSPDSLRLLGLTRREAEVLFWVAKDKSTADIALILGMSDRTVKKHLEHIYEKFGVQTRLAAVMYALEQLGILTT
jgi:DNA-binding CsgD family transcriptional regulator